VVEVMNKVNGDNTLTYERKWVSLN